MAKNGNKNLKPAEHFHTGISINLHLHTLTKFFLPLVTVIPAQTMTSPPWAKADNQKHRNFSNNRLIFPVLMIIIKYALCFVGRAGL